MQQHNPDLLSQIIKANNPNSEIIEAMKKGLAQSQKDKIAREQEKIKERHKQRKLKR